MGVEMSYTTIKSFSKSRYSVAVIQDDLGRYAVMFDIGDGPEYTSWTDYSNACYMFDLKIQDFEGI
jgi:hypothetical protein